jgi:hypothetical protein
MSLISQRAPFAQGLQPAMSEQALKKCPFVVFSQKTGFLF